MSAESADSIRKQIEEAQERRSFVLSRMQELGISKYRRPTTTDTNYTDPWDEYHELGENLSLLQSKLQSVLLQETKSAIRQLDSTTQSLNTSVGKVAESSNRLEDQTKAVAKESRHLGMLTTFLVLFASISLIVEVQTYTEGAETLAQAILVIIAVLAIALIAVYQFNHLWEERGKNTK